jgi:hypothetical protein
VLVKPRGASQLLRQPRLPDAHGDEPRVLLVSRGSRRWCEKEPQAVLLSDSSSGAGAEPRRPLSGADFDDETVTSAGALRWPTQP